MSADLVLISAPPNDEWLDRWTFYNGVSNIGEEGEDSESWDPENNYRNERGYIRDRRFDAVIEREGMDPSYGNGLTYEEWMGLRQELGLDILPSQWIGQVSWLKADIMGDRGKYVPGPVEGVVEVVHNSPVLTPRVATAIMAAMNRPNHSIYGHREIHTVLDGMYTDGCTKALGGSMYLFRKPGHRDEYSGVARRRAVKRWLSGQIGRRIVMESQ